MSLTKPGLLQGSEEKLLAVQTLLCFFSLKQIRRLDSTVAGVGPKKFLV